MLSDPPKRWEPPLPLDRIRDEDITYANSLRDVLRPWLTRGEELSQSSAEMQTSGTADYFRVFRSRISRRYWRELFGRTVQRDGGAEDWNRLEIYLPNKPKEKEPASRVVSEALAEEFGTVESYIKACGKPAALVVAEAGLFAQLLLQDHDLLLEVFDDALLVSVNPTSQRQQKELSRFTCTSCEVDCRGASVSVVRIVKFHECQGRSTIIL
jgi:hypothetical protein